MLTRDLLTTIVDASFTDNILDQNKVEQFAFYLSREELKVYIRKLKQVIKQRTISVALPSSSVYNTVIKEISPLFPDKEIDVKEDTTLLVGIKVVNDDLVYDFSLKNTLENLKHDYEE